MSQVLFILGAGPRIGWAVAGKFKDEGYKVAVGSRNPNIERATSDGFLPVSVDVTKSESVELAFGKVKEELGIPNVVVYNAANLTFPKDANDPLEIPPQDLEKDTAINLFGAYTAMREAVRGFKSLSDGDLPKVFIATGNVVPWQPSPFGITLGAGKAALVNVIGAAVKAYSEKHYRFYFASEVTDNGGPVPYTDIHAETHGRVYYGLVESSKKTQEAWDVRFRGNGDLVQTK